MSSKKETLLELKDVFASYRHEIALEGVHFTIKQNDFIALLGPNGGGKTTLLKVIMGLHPIESGELKFHFATTKDARKKTGYVPQHSKFRNDFPIRVEDAIKLSFVDSMTPFFKVHTSQKKSVQETMELLKLENLAGRSVNELSGGQLQRVLIARALVTKPKLLLLDEPIAHLDNASSNSLMQILQQISKDCAIVMTTHDTGALPPCFTSIGCLNKKMHYHGSPDLNTELLNELYGCEVDLIAHGVPHRVLSKHE